MHRFKLFELILSKPGRLEKAFWWPSSTFRLTGEPRISCLMSCSEHSWPLGLLISLCFAAGYSGPWYWRLQHEVESLQRLVNSSLLIPELGPLQSVPSEPVSLNWRTGIFGSWSTSGFNSLAGLTRGS